MTGKQISCFQVKCRPHDYSALDCISRWWWTYYVDIKFRILYKMYYS